MPFQSNITCFYFCGYNTPSSTPPSPHPPSRASWWESIFFFISIVTSCYDSFNCCYLLVIVVYFWHAWARLPLLPPEEMLFQAQIALRMFVHIAFVTSTLTEPSVVIFLFFLFMGVCVLGKVPYWNRWWRRRGRFEAAFLFVVFNIDRGGRRLGVPAEARRFLRKCSQVGNEAVWCCMFVRPPLPQAQTGAFGKALSRRMLLRCIVQKEKKRKTIVKSSSTSCSSPTPKPCFFFSPNTFRAESLVHKGPPHIVDPSLSFFYQSVTRPEMHSAGIHTCVYMSVRGVCMCVGSWVLSLFFFFFAVMLYRLLEY